MIARVWHGWTTPPNADVYENLLTTEIFPEIVAKNVAGFERIELFRRDLGEEVEFVTIMWFNSLQAVKAFRRRQPRDGLRTGSGRRGARPLR